MSYREVLPPPPLEPFVDRFWLRGDPGVPSSDGPHRVLPDGCIDAIIRVDRGQVSIVGTMTRALVTPPLGSACLVAVRFKPGGAVPFLGVSADELTDQSIPLEHLGLHRLDLRRAGGLTPLQALAALEKELLGRLSSVPKPDPVVAHAVARLLGPIPPSMSALAHELGRSRQHLGRMFLRHVGIGPKEFARVARLQRASAYLQRFGSRGLADSAVGLGYYDQAHMARDFRLLAGATVTTLRTESRSIFPIPFLSEGAGYTS